MQPHRSNALDGAAGRFDSGSHAWCGHAMPLCHGLGLISASGPRVSGCSIFVLRDTFDRTPIRDPRIYKL
jgi:hypothetical protein